MRRRKFLYALCYEIRLNKDDERLSSTLDTARQVLLRLLLQSNWLHLTTVICSYYWRLGGDQPAHRSCAMQSTCCSYSQHSSGERAHDQIRARGSSAPPPTAAATREK